VGLLLTAALIAAKHEFERGDFGRQIEQMTLNLHQIRLASAASRLPVAVVDITGVPRVPRAADDPTLVTDRRALSELVSAIAQHDPAAIGIDVLFDPPAAATPLPPDEARFFEQCLSVQDSTGRRIPTFVGIFEGVVKGPDRWLGEPRFGPLAAFILVPRPNDLPVTTSMLRYLRLSADGHQVEAISMAEALARSTGQTAARRWPGAWLAEHAPLFVEIEQHRGGEAFDSREFLIDFGALPELMATAVPAVTSADLAAAGASFAGKIVLIGRARTGETTDTFTVPAQAEPVPGVFVHAAATYTRVAAPLYRLTPAGRVAADVAAAVIPLGLVLAVRLRRLQGTPDAGAAHRLARTLTWSAAAAVFAIGYFWVVFTGILWTDYLMVVAALLLHGPLERVAAAAYRRWRGQRAPARQGGHA
jgi:hypothetical protein